MSKFEPGMIVCHKTRNGVLGKVVGTLNDGLVEVQWDKAVRYRNHPLVDNDEPQTVWENEDYLVDVSPIC